MDPVTVKYLHVLSSTVLFGTGVGSAYYLFVTSWSRDVHAIASITRHVVIADWLFTGSTVVIQPLTGFYLAHRLGIPLGTPWLYWSLVLYAIAVPLWFAAVWLQMKLRDVARAAHAAGTELPPRYAGYLGAWTAVGVLAFVAFLSIFYLMVAKRLPFA
ncbi:DUF2269 family protein [Vulcaniibacterium tengchongense]|uniref:Putative membrane protein n=1 Tax=Vulcaniibacterium tengchongense TaxID=1273429 RepID=A0A3N4VBP5_9GAMM|nr:DUF2269 domain-containing protein [Vulcaniibacterium tengchongense]RPE80038.1 putative membrane protein [Vulcaniibacterium tengchongense]